MTIYRLRPPAQRFQLVGENSTRLVLHHRGQSPCSFQNQGQFQRLIINLKVEVKIKIMVQHLPLWLTITVFLLGNIYANALSYDYSASIECLKSPQKPQYNGGIIANPELNDGSEGWSSFGYAKIEHRELNGNKFIVAHSRSNPHGSVSQSVYLDKNKIYTFSAWIQVSEGSNNVPVTATFKTKNGYKNAGAIVAQSNCWSMLKGGLTVDTSGLADLYFQSNNTAVEIWVDSISLQPCSQKQWKSHQDQSIEKNRKAKVRIQAVDNQGNPLPHANISIIQKKVNFPFGCAINKNILNNPAYQAWFTSRFTVTVFENELKWYSTEYSRGKIDYSVSDALVQFAKQNNIAVRGHNVIWNDPKYQPEWVKSLSPADLNKAATDRLNSVMSKYKGQLIGWDVVNENLHFNFLESKLGPDASSVFYNLAGKADGTTTLFLNEFSTIESSGDVAASPANYLKKVRSIQSYAGNGNLKLGIGLEGHFSTPNIPYIRSAIDTLAAANLPIWITEVDVSSGGKQVEFLEQILREVHSHPKVAGIVIWSAWSPQGCYRMCLTDNNFKNLPTGDVVDKLLHEWGGLKELFGSTDLNGFFETSLSHGDYHVKIHHPSANSSLDQQLNLDSSIDSDHHQELVLQFTA
ncbi:endo-1,4-beta-xylanase 5-like [Euphorbia lathyris]|uniref:endo-1,4-beta-xylanase 5-like n=1 Tax=Euphorbia lathyris TaxID=212925 RepID=UPI0033141F08